MRRATLAWAALVSTAVLAAEPGAAPSRPSLREHVKRAWSTLTRSVADLPKAAPDEKVPHEKGRPWPVYLSAREDRARVERALASSLDAKARAGIELRVLPAPPAGGRVPEVKEHGLLYLPRPYVVPGGRFNEMYGWDSYFIARGLLQDGEVALAADMVENHLYQVEHYGTVLNANRTYYLTRSQPPFLSRMVLEFHAARPDPALLRRARPALESLHRYWTEGEHRAGDTLLSRYWDFGEGPAPEVSWGEKDEKGRSHYDRVREAYRATSTETIAPFYDRLADRLTPLFFKGDRSMRESGFDPSDRFGRFGVEVVFLAPVCLNTLLFRLEDDLATIARETGDPKAAQAWAARAKERAARVDRLLWDEGAGLYFDHDLRTGQRRAYPFATTFFPLWAGLASRAQAARVRAALVHFEAPGGLLTSTNRSGSQWDAPFGWAPLQVLAVEGLRRYGFTEDADRIAKKFLDLVEKEYGEHGAVVEKYDVVRRESDVAAGLVFGYTSNEIGFGWTNAAVVEFSRSLARRTPR